tara:strand:+ start:724 stop:1107 length:384 start_codon:yes stop_codon:yes gene_type:complete
LLELPHRRLIQGSLYQGGECCVLGALAIYRLKKGVHLIEISTLEEFDEDSYRFDESEYELIEFAQNYLGMAMTLAWKISYMNDEINGDCTPEQRWKRMMVWIETILFNKEYHNAPSLLQKDKRELRK